MNSTSHSRKEKTVFWIHFVIVVLAWTGPFLFSWPLMILAYGIAIAQFLYYKRCLMNAAHGLDDSEDHTFYSQIFELAGFRPDRRKLKHFVRGYLYILLGIFTLIWQLGYGAEAILF